MDESQLSEPTSRWLAQGRHVEAGGHRLFVYERGQGPVVLLMHGFPTSCHDWRGVIDGLSDAYRCVTFDFPGYGLSDKPVAYSYSLFQQADAVEALAAALGIDAAHVVSHDMGTSVHNELLAREQEGGLGFGVVSSTFLNGSMLQEMATITPFQRLLGSNETMAQGIAICETMAANYVEGLKGLMKRPQALTADDAIVLDELLRLHDGNRRLPAMAGYMRERYVHKNRWIGALKGAKPVQLVWAEGDPVANVQMGRALSKELPQARYTELSGLGHFLLMEDPPAIAKHIREFIGDPK